MNTQERFDNLPNQFQSIDVRSVVSYWLKGQYASANHPTTSLNPTEYFVISEVKVEEDRETGIGQIYVRGKETMWFHQDMIKIDVVGI